MIQEKLQATGYRLPDVEKKLEAGSWKLEAKVFTMFSNKHTLVINGVELPIITALPRRLFSIFTYFNTHKTRVLSKLFDYRNLMFFYPVLMGILERKIKAYGPNEIYISSFAAAKNIDLSSFRIQNSEFRIDLHAQSPFMYIHNHFENNLKKLKFPIKQFYQLAYTYLHPRDIKPRHYDKVTANSGYTAKLLKDIYNLNIDSIQYPKLNPLFFSHQLNETRSNSLDGKPSYFIFIGRLVTFSKQVDIVIKAFNETGLKLKIIGSGPDEAYLKSIAGTNIEFLGWISDPKQRCELISGAQALVNITLESFGYVTAESLCLGTPVIGYNQGATPELIMNYKLGIRSGILIEHQTINALTHGLEEFETHDWDHKTIAQQARHRLEASDVKFELY